MTARVRIGTRGSPLALWQARHVAALLGPACAVEIVEIETEGDRVRDRPLSQIGGIGLFTKEVQNAVLDGRADVAVHSLKDLPTVPVDGLVLAAVPERGPVGDVFVSTQHRRFDDLPPGAAVATSSLRRRSQLLHRRPDLRVESVRGNVATRLRKLQEQALDAIILAEAGLRRLGLEGHITELLGRDWMLPAVGQGALGLECRADDAATRELLRPLNHLATWRAVTAERELLAALGGGCLVPIGSIAEADGAALHLRGAVLSPDGTRRVAGELRGPADDAEGVGRRLAERLLGEGAAEVLAMR